MTRGKAPRKPKERSDGKPSVTPARGYDLDAVVREVAGMMARCQWVTGKSHQELADRYGVTPVAVQAWAAQASRHLRLLASEDPEHIRMEIVAGIQHVRTVALGKIRKFSNVHGEVIEYADPDCRTALSTFELLAKAYGVLVEKHEHKVNLGEWTEEQLLEELRKAGYDVSKREPETAEGEEE